MNKKAAAIVTVSAAALICGWRLFWFLTDDAFIVFRYAANSRLGHGYVWNPPPFLPVEGYTSFLWLLLVDGIWRLTEIPPPSFVNTLSLLFSFFTLLLTAAMVLRMRLNSTLQPYRLRLLALVMAGIVFNRTFLAWSSSGLETAMFNCLVTAWVFAVLFLSGGSLPWVAALSTTASLIYLTRPDGLLFVPVSVALVASALLKGRDKTPHKWAWLALPILTVLLHLWWRHTTYGEWLPNTYYAKYTAPWPAMGTCYALSFILEYALWGWLALAAWAMIPRLHSRAPERDAVPPREHGGAARLPAPEALVVLGTLLVHWAYYTFVIGGDHFEYRVYSHLVPLIFVSSVWMLNRLTRLKSAHGLALLTAVFLLSLPIPWTHWWLTRDLTTREDTHMMHVPVANSWPRSMQWYARGFDRLQSHLIRHYVCIRHQEHKICWKWQLSRFPSRVVGSALPTDDYPVLVVFGAGVPGWVLPRINIIDYWGLNDPVIAHNPQPAGGARRLAHERLPPAGYIEGLFPNVEIDSSTTVRIHERAEPLTAPQIESHQQMWLQQM